MEKLSLKNLVSSSHNCFFVKEHSPSKLSQGYRRICIQTRKFCPRMRCSQLLCYSKASDYQDFQGYAKPLRLLPAMEPDTCSNSLLEDLSSSSIVDESQSIYIVKLQTSVVSGSSLSDSNAGILLCLIDENGDSILRRMSASSAKGPQIKETSPDFLPFQRGSIDQFIFVGPKLAKVEAFWIGPESDQWRLGAASLMVVHRCQPPSDHNEDDNTKSISYIGLQYDFEVEDIHLGLGESMSMVELRPFQITELNGSSLLTLLTTSLSTSTLLLNREIMVSKEESMREYADLKTSLLLYDAMLIFAGTSVTAFFTGEKMALAFLIGGAGGFLYLLLLQRSVDGLPAPASISMTREKENLGQLFGQLKAPISSLVLAFVFAVIAVKYQTEATVLMLTPQELLLGMTGFLACKVAVVFAALKPVPSKLENK